MNIRKRKQFIVFLITPVLILFYGCTVFDKYRHYGSDLDVWIRTEAFPEIVKHLRTNSQMRNLGDGSPFQIVKVQGQVVEREIDRLSEYLRNCLEDELLKYPDIKLARMHPAEIAEKPYRLQDIRCDKSDDIKMLITMDISMSEFRANHANVRFRAIDLDKNEWVRGFSIATDAPLRLTPLQKKKLEKKRKDDYLKGASKSIPFSELEHDEAGAFLAKNLTCIFKEGYTRNDIDVHIDKSKLQDQYLNIVNFMENQLNKANEINITKERENASWIIEVDPLETGAGSGFYKLYARTYHREKENLLAGLTTYAYISGQMVGPKKVVKHDIRPRRDNYFDNAAGIGIEMIPIVNPSNTGDVFFISKNPITKGQFVRFLNNSNFDKYSFLGNVDRLFLDVYSDDNPFNPDWISQDNGMDLFIQWLNEQSVYPYTYALPSEMHYEIIARVNPSSLYDESLKIVATESQE